MFKQSRLRATRARSWRTQPECKIARDQPKQGNKHTPRQCAPTNHEQHRRNAIKNRPRPNARVQANAGASSRELTQIRAVHANARFARLRDFAAQIRAVRAVRANSRASRAFRANLRTFALPEKSRRRPRRSRGEGAEKSRRSRGEAAERVRNSKNKENEQKQRPYLKNKNKLENREVAEKSKSNPH